MLKGTIKRKHKIHFSDCSGAECCWRIILHPGRNVKLHRIGWSPEVSLLLEKTRPEQILYATSGGVWPDGAGKQPRSTGLLMGVQRQW